MEYTTEGCFIRLVVKDIPQDLLLELKEFLRVNVIVSATRGIDIDDDNGQGYFSGFFNRKSIKIIEKWLRGKGVQKTDYQVQ